MTTTRTSTRRTRRTCQDCGIRPVGTDAPRGVQLCDPCNEYAEWENEHSDNGHGTGADDNQPHDCPVCFPELDPRTDAPAPRTGHHNTVAKTRTSHAGHDHPATPKARAACRKAQAQGKVIKLANTDPAAGPTHDLTAALDKAMSTTQAMKIEELAAPVPASLVEGVKAHALAHYNDGGWDVIVEAWTDDDIAKAIGGARTLRGALRKLSPTVAVWADRQADAENSAF